MNSNRAESANAEANFTTAFPIKSLFMRYSVQSDETVLRPHLSCTSYHALVSNTTLSVWKVCG